MASQAIFIITRKFDPHADSAIRQMRERGIPFFRLNTDSFHEEFSVTATASSSSITFADRWGRKHSYPDGTLAVWHRKPTEPPPPAALMDEAARRVAFKETLEFLTYPSTMQGVPWINNPNANVVAARKFPQLAMADKLGLRTPRTIITNEPERAKSFADEIGGQLLCKSMSAYEFSKGEANFFIFSRKVAAEEFDNNLESVALCPTFLQEYIRKDHELRVTIFGDRTFCCRIDSQQIKGAETDWRQVDPFLVPHRMVPLDEGVERGLRSMMRRTGLVYAAFDLIVTPAGEHVFLEMNPNGQWLWMEMITGAPMTAALLDLLVGDEGRRDI